MRRKELPVSPIPKEYWEIQRKALEKRAAEEERKKNADKNSTKSKKNGK